LFNAIAAAFVPPPPQSLKLGTLSGCQPKPVPIMRVEPANVV
jgi:hypothetical protein